ncbi:MAG TPA: Imm52 family immunity protein [Roseiarcus sp.]|nr:Imm52 family immunity protein [Roseiarcus sp.]
MSEETYALQCWWGSRQEDAESCAVRLMKTMGRLASIDGAFRNWDKCGLSADQKQLGRLFNVNRYFYDYPPDKVIMELGFRVRMTNQARRPDAALIDMQVGAFGSENPHRNHLVIVPSERRADTRQPWTASNLRLVMRVAIEEWNVQEASVDCFRYFDCKRSQIGPSGQKRLFSPWEGWITYLPPSQARLVTAPKGVGVEVLADGGTLYTLCEEPFTIENPKHMALAGAMQRALAPVQRL